MSTDNTKFTISLKDGILEFEGSEKFVTEQLKRFDGIINEMMSKPVKPLNLSPKPQGDANFNSKNGVGDEGLENVIQKIGEEIKIAVVIPGDNNVQKTKNAALLYLYGKKVYFGVDSEVDFNEISKVCKDHGCFDSKNFSKHMKSAKPSIVVTGKGKKQKASLTPSGEKEVKKLINEINVELSGTQNTGK